MKPLSQTRLILNSFFIASAMFASAVPTLIIVPLMLAGSGWDVSGCYQAICVSMALASMIALFTTKIPLMIGPQIAGVSYLVGHLHDKLGYGVSLLSWTIMGSALFFFLAIALELPQRLMKAFGPTLQQAITATLGAFFIVLAFREFPQLRISLVDLGSQVASINWMVGSLLVVLLPTLVIEGLKRRGLASAMVLGMLISLLIGSILRIEHGVSFLSQQPAYQWMWLDADLIQSEAGGWHKWIWGVFGLWMIQTLDVAGCSLAMSDLAAKRWGMSAFSSDLKVEDAGRPASLPTPSQLYRLAPLGTLLGFCCGNVGASGPHCICLSSAAALCAPASQSLIATGMMASTGFLLMLPLKSQVMALPLYLSLPVILWIGFAMLRHLPIATEDRPLGDLIAGWIMVGVMLATGQLLPAMAVGVWVASLWNLLIDRKLELARVLLSLLFILSQLASV